MGGRESVLCTELPSCKPHVQSCLQDWQSVIRSYEVEHDIVILDPEDYENVVKQSELHPNLALEPENLFQFLLYDTLNFDNKNNLLYLIKKLNQRNG